MPFVDLRHQRFGELTVLYEVARKKRTHAGHNREWMCRCDCGRKAIRTTTQLHLAKRNGSSPCCALCLRELRGGMVEEYKGRMKEVMQYWWEEYGTLYPHYVVESLTQDVRDDMAQAIGFYPDDVDPFHQVISVPRSEEEVGDEEVVLVYDPTLPMAKWVEWQTAVDFAMENWARGLPRQAIEKMLYRSYVDPSVGRKDAKAL